MVSLFVLSRSFSSDVIIGRAFSLSRKRTTESSSSTFTFTAVVVRRRASCSDVGARAKEKKPATTRERV